LVAILPFGVAFLTTFVLVPPVRRFAVEWRLGDKPNGRKLQARAIPHLGGIAIFGGFFLALLTLLATPFGISHAGRVLALFPGLLIVFGLGLVDDLRGLGASVKLLYQLLAAACVVAMGASLHDGNATMAFGLVLGMSILWYVGVCNSVNLIDGLDGLAAGTSAVAALGFLVVGVRLGDAAVVLVALSLTGALTAFLRFNFHPARIFMGDTGSMFIGFTLAFLACLLAQSVGLWTALLGSAAILGVPVLDTATAILRRVAARRHIFKADGEHTHHKLMKIGLSHRAAVLVLCALSAVFAVLGGGALLGATQLLFWALGLAVTLALSIAILSRATRASWRPEEPATDAWQPAVVRDAAMLPEPVMAVSRERTRGEGEVLAEVPPAVGGRLAEVPPAVGGRS
jgi:UDP-GlcNAc:undecaprenyl-phosphate GlcNAc-1-phosphate transferase